MQNIKIICLELENFKNHRHLKLDFNGRNASIYGDNATGKTSVYDALTWLLFGKDSSGNGEKNIEIKPLDALGNVRDHLAVTSVEAVLLVNGDEVSLRRTYKEVWSTKRGSSEATYDGNTSEYYVDGVPCKKNAFQSKVGELVEEDTFRLLTSVSHFANDISWKDRREVLFRVAGVMDDQTILATDARFAPLMEGMGRLGLDDYKKKLQAEKKGFTGVKDQTPARINECEKTIADVEVLDFSGAKAALELLNARMDDANNRMAAIRNNNAVQQKELQIQGARIAMKELESENDAFRSNQKIALDALERENQAYRDSQESGVDTAALKAGVRTMSVQLEIKRGQMEREQNHINRLDQDVERHRKNWVTANNEVFTGTICPTCGQTLPAESQKKAREAFEAGKQRRLDEITRQAGDAKQNIEAARERLISIGEDIARLEADILAQEQIIAESEANVKPIVDMADYAERKKPIVDMADYAERKKAIQDDISKLTGELFDLQADSAASLDLIQQEKDDIQAQIRKHQDTISKESLLGYSKKRIEELREDARNAAAALEAIEQMLFLMDEYSRYKTRFVEDSINGLFRIARFRLFREQANGGVEERCDVVHDGVPYISVNNGMKINLGIDIINTLSTAFGVSVPLFIDNAEAVTRLETCASQIIRLVVSENDKELRVNYEN